MSPRCSKSHGGSKESRPCLYPHLLVAILIPSRQPLVPEATAGYLLVFFASSRCEHPSTIVPNFAIHDHGRHATSESLAVEGSIAAL